MNCEYSGCLCVCASSHFDTGWKFSENIWHCASVVYQSACSVYSDHCSKYMSHSLYREVILLIDTRAPPHFRVQEVCCWNVTLRSSVEFPTRASHIYAAVLTVRIYSLNQCIVPMKMKHLPDIHMHIIPQDYFVGSLKNISEKRVFQTKLRIYTQCRQPSIFP